MAVQILAYEVRVAYLDRQQANAPVEEEEEAPYPLVDDLERFYQHLEQVLSHSGFIRQAHPGQIMKQIKAPLYPRSARGSRAEYSTWDADIHRKAG